MNCVMDCSSAKSRSMVDFTDAWLLKEMNSALAEERAVVVLLLPTPGRPIMERNRLKSPEINRDASDVGALVVGGPALTPCGGCCVADAVRRRMACRLSRALDNRWLPIPLVVVLLEVRRANEPGSFDG